MSDERSVEHSTKIIALGKAMLKASEAMEESDWQACQTYCAEAARLARVLQLIERQRAKENG